MRRVLILGGGFGGLSTAHHLRDLLGDDVEITLVDRETHFFMGFRKSLAIAGREPIEGGMRALEALSARGIRVVHGAIERIDPAARAAIVDGEQIDADALVVALGADLDPSVVPGLAEHGINVYSTEGVPRARDALAAMRAGELVVGIFGVPYKCPAAPYEMAILCNDSLRASGSTARVTVFTPQSGSLPVLGAAGCSALEGRLAANGITFMANAKAERVEPGRVVLGGGGLPLVDDIGFDVLFGIPPHRCPAIVVDAGLAAPGGWVNVNPRTLETGVDGVYAIGDVTALPMANGQPIPKAGAFADGEGRAVAGRIAARLRGEEPASLFDGAGACFLEVGGGEAMIVRGDFLAEPGPDVELSAPSPEVLAEKALFERGRLDDWFGISAGV